MINRIFRGSILLPLIFFLCLAGSQAKERNRLHPPSDNKVVISILSKHLRLMKEAASPPLEFTFPSGTYAVTGKKKITISSASIYYNGNTFIFSLNGRDTRSDRIVIRGHGYAACTVNNQKREYALPLRIYAEGNELPLVLTDENPEQYSIDSAAAELGEKNCSHRAALDALSHIIYARAASSIYKKHRAYDFCDLTCCQIYRGRTRYRFDDRFTIENPDDIPFFFHSSNGGRIFTESVFSPKARIKNPAQEYSYNDKRVLSSSKYRNWKRKIDLDEISEILFLNGQVIRSVEYFKEREQIHLCCDDHTEIMSPETFRLMINRKKGWNFIKSNNYRIEKSVKILYFHGTGLGHGAGLSMEGAIELSKMGYSSEEILKHYFPDIRFSGKDDYCFSYQAQYVLMDSVNSTILNSSQCRSFLNRRIPCGSLFKTVTALYLALYRRDIIHRYRYYCNGHMTVSEKNIQCWRIKGHGETGFKDALSSSCNLYFASLYREIDQKNFMNFLHRLSRDYGISFEMKENYDSAGFSKILCGLDFEIKITVSDLVTLTQLFQKLADNRISGGILKKIGREEAVIISEALHRTFLHGTAKPETTGTDKLAGIWGKTGTVMTGTNYHSSYGIFIGGNGSTGIVSILPESNGKNCAKFSLSILLKSRK